MLQRRAARESRTLGPVADEHEQERGSPASATARTSTSCAFSGTSRETDRTTTSSAPARSSRSQLRPPLAEPVRALAEGLDVDRVREDPHALGLRSPLDHRPPRERPRRRARRPPRARSEARSPPSPCAASPGRGPSSWLSTTSTYGTRRKPAPGDRPLRRERAPAGDDDDVRLRASRARARSRA